MEDARLTPLQYMRGVAGVAHAGLREYVEGVVAKHKVCVPAVTLLREIQAAAGDVAAERATLERLVTIDSIHEAYWNQKLEALA